MARSNGKSWLAARLAADYLATGPERSECLLVASSLTQAGVIFRYVLGAAGLDAPGCEWVLSDGQNVSLIRNRETGRAVRALGSDPRRAHGRVFGLALLDEPAQWPPGTRDAMLAAIRTGAGKVEGARVVALGTRPADSGHWFSEWLLGGGPDYPQAHSAAPDDPPFTLSTIRKANQGLDALPALKADLLAQREEARAGGMARARWDALALNLDTADVAESLLLEPDAWCRCETDALPEREGPRTPGLERTALLFALRNALPARRIAALGARPGSSADSWRGGS